MKTLNMAILAALTLICACAIADQQISTDFSGKTADGTAYKVTRRAFTPGSTEVEIDLGRGLNKSTQLLGAYLINTKGQELLGGMIQTGAKIGKVGLFGQFTYFRGQNGTPDKARLILSASTPIGKRLTVGLCGLASQNPGKDPYWEVGPTLRYQLVTSKPGLSVQIQPIIKAGEGKGVNLFLSTQL